MRERAEAASLKVEVDIPAHLPELYADARKFKQILLNLLSNAVKFTLGGGKVTIHVETDPKTGFRITVVDTGIGMSPEEISKALSPFEQIDSRLSRKYEGTGLGLPLAKAMVERHGGTLELESVKGLGTTVTIVFPPQRIVRAKDTEVDRASVGA